jgi:hypothetical protein
MLYPPDMRILTVIVAAALGTGCYATTSSGYTPAYVGPSVSVSATTVGPDLVYVSPGVQVIADYDEPIFYSDGFYWRESGGLWYRSSYHTHGWATYGAPRSIISIRDRHSYRRYRPAGYTPRNRGYNARPNNRGYDARPTYDRNRGATNQYDRRDNRWERRDNRRDNARPVINNNRQERRDDRRDDRKDRRDDRRDDRKDRRR